jgi:hypothetical protein
MHQSRLRSLSRLARDQDGISDGTHLGGRFSMKANIPSRGSSDSPRAHDMVDAGLLGRKSGRGFHHYA